MGKTRVAPIKTTTMPKLELQAALHASRLKMLILEEHDISIDRVYMWSDSTTVQWLNAFDKKQQIFVANRIGEILEKKTKLGEWNHIPGAQNPADLGTRGMRANEVATSVRLNGPVWLRKNEALWPKATTQHTIVEETLEITQVVIEFICGVIRQQYNG